MKQSLLSFAVAENRKRADDRKAVVPSPSAARRSLSSQPWLHKRQRLTRPEGPPASPPPAAAASAAVVAGARAMSAKWPEVIEIDDSDDSEDEHVSLPQETEATLSRGDRRRHVSSGPDGATVTTGANYKNQKGVERYGQGQLSVGVQTATKTNHDALSARSPGVPHKWTTAAGVPGTGSHRKPVARTISLSPPNSVTGAVTARDVDRLAIGSHSRVGPAAHCERAWNMPLKSAKTPPFAGDSQSPSATSSTASSSRSHSSAWSAGTVTSGTRKGPLVSKKSETAARTRLNPSSNAKRKGFGKRAGITKASNKKAPSKCHTMPLAAAGVAKSIRPIRQEEQRQRPQQQFDEDIPECLRYVPPPLYTWEEFEEIVYYIAEHCLTFAKYVSERDPLEAIEYGICAKANNQLEDKYNRQFQQKAQYGRVLFKAVDKLFGPDFFNLKKSDTFVDLGHGTGLIVLQAAFTVGCPAVGIELDSGRFAVSECLYDAFHRELTYIQNRSLKDRENEPSPQGGEVSFYMGSFSHAAHRGISTNEGRITKCFVNNFNGVFGERSKNTTRGSVYYLNDFIAALFARMQPGSIMITLDKLDLGLSRDEARDLREHNHLEPHENASFYDVETLILGAQKDTVSWSDGGGCETPVKVYKYIRVGESKFVCCSKNCSLNQTPQDAVEYRLENGSLPTKEHLRNQEDVMVIRTCRECRGTSRSARERNSPRKYKA